MSCPHCPGGMGLSRPLLETPAFSVVCDMHPVIEGHILIIPRAHVACMGALPADGFAEFLRLREVVARFLSESYGSCAEFEHGVMGQTVLHAHFHMLPFDGKGKDAVPEEGALRSASIASLPGEFARQGLYLYLRARDGEFFADTELGTPRFFRDRIAAARGEPERGSWQAMRKDPALMSEVEAEIRALERRSKGYLS